MVFDPSLVPNSQKLKLTLDSTPISADQANFPLTVVLDGTDPLHAALFGELAYDRIEWLAGFNSLYAVSNGGKTVTRSGANAWGHQRADSAVESTGKWYWECSVGTAVANILIGVNISTDANTVYPGQNSTSYGYHADGRKFNNAAASAYGDSYTSGDVIGVAIDLDNGEIYFSKNGVWQNSGDPVARTNPAYTGLSGEKIPSIGIYSTGGVVTIQSEPQELSYSIPTGFSGIGTDDRRKMSIQSGTTQLPVEIEHWDATAEKAILHTKVPTYAAAADGELILSYDSSQDDNDTYIGVTGSTPAQSVWDSNFAAVYHMAQDPSGTAPQVFDSTANGRDLTAGGSMTAGDLVDGDVGKAIDFDGVDDNLTSGTFDLSALQTAVTLEVRAKWQSLTAYDMLLSVGETASGCLQLGIGASTSFIGNMVGGDIVNTAIAPDTSNYQTLSQTISSGLSTMYNNGTADATTNSVTVQNLSTAEVRVGARFDGYNGHAFIAEVRVSSVVRSTDWIKLTSLSLADQLITWSAYSGGAGSGSASGSGGVIPLPVIRQIVDLHYALYGPRAIVSLEYGLLTNVRNIVNIIYGIKLAAIVELLYGNTPVVKQRVVLPYGDAARLVRIIQLRYGDTAQFRQIVDLLYNVQGDIRQIVNLNYSITEEELRAIIELKYDLRVYDEWRKIVDIIYGIASGESLEEVTTLAFTTSSGDSLDPFHVNIEKEEGKGFDVAFKSHREIDYEACVPPVWNGTSWEVTTVQVTVNSDVYTVVVEERDITREQPEAQYEITMRSQLFLLDAPYASTISEELSGMAQSIVEDLLTRELPAATLTWTMVNWYIPVNTLVAADQTPLELIQQIVEAGGGLVEADEDGNMVCRPKWPVNLPDYATTTPELYLTDQDNFYTVASQTMKKPGYNNFFISDQTPSAEGLTIEVREVSATRKEVLVFQVPWESDDIRLRTSGGSNVAIYEDGVVVELIEDEIVEIVDGQGQSEYPIYQEVSHDYRETDLGSVTTEEDGTVETSTVHNSLIALTYRTRYHKFTVVDSQIESVQFWPEII